MAARLKREWREQGCGRQAERHRDGDEIIHVATASGAFGPTDGDVREGTPLCRAQGGKVVLGHSLRHSKALNGASGMEADGANFDRSGSHDI
ncbi:hypothetical protein [Streptomyces sp. NPDC001348]